MVKQGHVSHPAVTDCDAHGKVRYQYRKMVSDWINRCAIWSANCNASKEQHIWEDSRYVASSVSAANNLLFSTHARVPRGRWSWLWVGNHERSRTDFPSSNRETIQTICKGGIHSRKFHKTEMVRHTRMRSHMRMHEVIAVRRRADLSNVHFTTGGWPEWFFIPCRNYRRLPRLCCRSANLQFIHWPRWKGPAECAKRLNNHYFVFLNRAAAV